MIFIPYIGLAAKCENLSQQMHSCAFFFFFFSDNATDKTYIMMEARLGALFKSEGEYTLLDKYVQKDHFKKT